MNKAMQRANKEALSKIDPSQIYHTFPDRREGSKSSLILKKTKTKKSNQCPVYDETAERGTSGMARQDEAGRTERPGKVQQLRSAVPLTRRLPIAPDV